MKTKQKTGQVIKHLPFFVFYFYASILWQIDLLL